jgi:hypothetical protein
VLGALGLVDGPPGHVHRVTDAVAGLRRVRGHPGAFADDLELVDRVRALQVAGHEQRRVPLRREPARQLAGERGLAGALETGEHDHARRCLGQAQPAGLAAEDADELLVDDFHDLLGRVQRAGDLRALGALLDVGDERADHRKRDVRLQQRDPDLARGGVHVGVGQPAATTEVLQDRREPVGESVEHDIEGSRTDDVVAGMGPTPRRAPPRPHQRALPGARVEPVRLRLVGAA